VGARNRAWDFPFPGKLLSEQAKDLGSILLASFCLVNLMSLSALVLAELCHERFWCSLVADGLSWKAGAVFHTKSLESKCSSSWAINEKTPLLLPLENHLGQ